MTNSMTNPYLKVLRRCISEMPDEELARINSTHWEATYRPFDISREDVESLVTSEIASRITKIPPNSDLSDIGNGK